MGSTVNLLFSNVSEWFSAYKYGMLEHRPIWFSAYSSEQDPEKISQLRTGRNVLLKEENDLKPSWHHLTRRFRLKPSLPNRFHLKPSAHETISHEITCFSKAFQKVSLVPFEIACYLSCRLFHLSSMLTRTRLLPKTENAHIQ